MADRPRRWRYLSAMAVVVLMVAVAERTGEREVIFPEMAALAIGMWIAPKRVWNVTRLQLVLLMGAGAVAGVCIVRWSPWPLAANLALAFAFGRGVPVAVAHDAGAARVGLYAARAVTYRKLGLSRGGDGDVADRRCGTAGDGARRPASRDALRPAGMELALRRRAVDVAVAGGAGRCRRCRFRRDTGIAFCRR